MNIFFLDDNHERAARYHCDKHVVKMMLEYAQLMSTAHRYYGNDDPRLYKATHENHPCAVWVRQSSANYVWLYKMWRCLSREYAKRYGRVHKSWHQLARVLWRAPKGIPRTQYITPRPRCMPDSCLSKGVVESYRKLYRTEKRSMLSYKAPSTEPNWL